MQTRHRDEVHVITGEFGELRDLRLDEYAGLCGVYANAEIVEGHLDYVVTHLAGVMGVVGKRLGVSDHYVDALVFAGVLQLHPAAQRPHIMTNMKSARGPVAGKDYLIHLKTSSPCDAREMIYRPMITQASLAADGNT